MEIIADLLAIVNRAAVKLGDHEVIYILARRKLGYKDNMHDLVNLTVLCYLSFVDAVF